MKNNLILEKSEVPTGLKDVITRFWNIISFLEIEIEGDVVWVLITTSLLTECSSKVNSRIWISPNKSTTFLERMQVPSISRLRYHNEGGQTNRLSIITPSGQWNADLKCSQEICHFFTLHVNILHIEEGDSCKELLLSLKIQQKLRKPAV